MESSETKKQQDDLERRKKAFVDLFNTEDGQIVLEDLERWCYVKTTTFPFNSPNALTMAFNEGKRAVMLHIRTMRELDIKRIREMLNQYNQEE